MINRTGKVVDSYAVAGIPSHFFVDKEGVIKAVLVGPVGSTDAKEFLQKIIP